MPEDSAMFPDGKLNAEDEGALAVLVGLEDGRVVLRFPEPVEWIAMTGDQAADLAGLLLTWARRAGLKKPFTLTIGKPPA